MIIVGSRALALRYPTILDRKPVDFDFICSINEANAWVNKYESSICPTKTYEVKNKLIIEGSINCEFEIIKENHSSNLFNDFVINDKQTINTDFGLVPHIDLLFLLKSSHKYLKDSPHFWKTAIDYHKIKDYGGKIRDEHKELLALREKETYDYAHPKLNQSKKDFFSDDNINYQYDHDEIHECVKHLDKPAYKYYMANDAEVMWDKNKFLSCPREIQLYGVLEESYVLALERSLIPHPGVLTPKQAFAFSLSKVCTSITSGKFREFAYENIFDVFKMYNEDYYSKFLKRFKG